VFVYALIFAFLGVMCSRYLFYRYVSLDKIQRRVLVLGTGEKAKQLNKVNNRGNRQKPDITAQIHCEEKDKPLANHQA
jgi:hypothetical protein